MSRAYFQEYAALIAEKGYEILEIIPGTKHTPRAEWTADGLTTEQIECLINGGSEDLWPLVKPEDRGRWSRGGRGAHGVGILSRRTPLVDIDCYDAEMVSWMADWIDLNIGEGVRRTGRAPKLGIMFRTDKPFSKVQSKAFLSGGKKQKLEILGDGQQFVAFAVHPDTGRPYQWVGKANPVRIAWSDLPLLTLADAEMIVTEFERAAVERKWPVAKATGQVVSRRENTSAGEIDDEFIDVKQVCGLTIEQVREALFKIENGAIGGDVDYDDWAKIGLAVYHETDGSDEGFALWDEWSAQSGKNETKGTSNRAKWNSFEIAGKGREPVTFRYVLKLVQSTEEAELADKVAEIRLAIMDSTTLTELNDRARRLKKFDLFKLGLDRESAIADIVKTFKKLENKVLPRATVEKLIKFENDDRSDTPKWLEDYCFLRQTGMFYDRAMRSSLVPRNFDLAFGPQMLSASDVREGKARSDVLPSDFALNVVQIPQFEDMRYMPDQEADFWLDGRHFCNAYSKKNIPVVPSVLSGAARKAQERVLAHFGILVPDERDRRLLLDWLAYIVQTSRKPNWAIMLQGVEGDGKSWLRSLMNEVLGAGNVRPVDADRLKETFNGYAEGSQLLVFEEVKLPHHTAAETMNKIKPLITNAVIEIRRMRTDSYAAPNTSAILILTNFRDALRIANGDTRYFPIFSRFANEDQRDSYFRDKACAEWSDQKDYFAKLYAVIREHPGALRKLFLDRVLSDEFNGEARAPRSSVRHQMVMLGKGELQEKMEEVMESHPGPDMRPELLNATKLLDLMEQTADELIPKTSSVQKLLTTLGYTFLGKFRVGGPYQRYWTQTPDAYPPVSNQREVGMEIRKKLLNDDSL